MFSNVSPRNVQSQLSHHGSISHSKTGEENFALNEWLIANSDNGDKYGTYSA